MARERARERCSGPEDGDDLDPPRDGPSSSCLSRTGVSDDDDGDGDGRDVDDEERRAQWRLTRTPCRATSAGATPSTSMCSTRGSAAGPTAMFTK